MSDYRSLLSSCVRGTKLVTKKNEEKIFTAKMNTDFVGACKKKQKKNKKNNDNNNNKKPNTWKHFQSAKNSFESSNTKTIS